MTFLTSGSFSYSGPDLAGLAVAGVVGVEHAVERDALAHDVRRHRLGDPVARARTGSRGSASVSLTAALALIVPNVLTCAVYSSPYFSVT